MEDKKQIFKNIYKHVVDYTKEHKILSIFYFIYFCIFAIFLYSTWDSYKNIFNIEVILMIVPCVLIIFPLVIIGINKYLKEHWSSDIINIISASFTLVSIIFAVLFFLWQETQEVERNRVFLDEQKKINQEQREQQEKDERCATSLTLEITTLDNYYFASSTVDSFDTEEELFKNFQPKFYLIDVYKNNIDFFYKHFGIENSIKFINYLNHIEAANGLISLVQELNVYGAMPQFYSQNFLTSFHEYNKDIANRSEGIKIESKEIIDQLEQIKQTNCQK